MISVTTIITSSSTLSKLSTSTLLKIWNKVNFDKSEESTEALSNRKKLYLEIQVSDSTAFKIRGNYDVRVAKSYSKPALL